MVPSARLESVAAVHTSLVRSRQQPLVSAAWLSATPRIPECSTHHAGITLVVSKTFIRHDDATPERSPHGASGVEFSLRTAQASVFSGIDQAWH
jgi:hypothetical protein